MVLLQGLGDLIGLGVFLREKRLLSSHPTLEPRHVKNTRDWCHRQRVTSTCQILRQQPPWYVLFLSFQEFLEGQSVDGNVTGLLVLPKQLMFIWSLWETLFLLLVAMLTFEEDKFSIMAFICCVYVFRQADPKERNGHRVIIENPVSPDPPEPLTLRVAETEKVRERKLWSS